MAPLSDHGDLSRNPEIFLGGHVLHLNFDRGHLISSICSLTTPLPTPKESPCPLSNTFCWPRGTEGVKFAVLNIKHKPCDWNESQHSVTLWERIGQHLKVCNRWEPTVMLSCWFIEYCKIKHPYSAYCFYYTYCSHMFLVSTFFLFLYNVAVTPSLDPSLTNTQSLFSFSTSSQRPHNPGLYIETDSIDAMCVAAAWTAHCSKSKLESALA